MFNRRDFLVSTAGVASGLALPMAHAETGADPPTDPLNVALIGVGYQGRILLDATMPIAGVRCRALCDIWDSARRYGQTRLSQYDQQASAYVDYREMLDREPDLDAVLVATPDFVHADQVNACLERGLHVYCEPLLAHNAPTARGMVETARRTGKLLQVGYQRRSHPRYRHVVDKLLREAALTGPLTAVQTRWAQEAADLRGWPRRFTLDEATLRQYGYQDMTELRNWIWYPQFGGGPFCAFVAQQIDVCQWFLECSPQSVMASGGNDLYRDRACYDTVLSVFEFPRESGAIRASCDLYTTTSAGGTRQFERFCGVEGSLQISENPLWTRIGREPNAADWDDWVRRRYLVKPDTPAVHAATDDALEVHVSGEVELFQLPELTTVSNCQAHLENFFAAVRGEEPLRCPAEVAYPSHVAAWKALEAVRARETLTIDPAEYAV
jgi:predicted dehydrogenase